MVRIPFRRWWPALLLAALPASQAQPRPDPADPAASAPPLLHRSAMAGYRAHADATPLGWKAANEQVNRIGGWRAYAREAAQPASAPASAPLREHDMRRHHHGGPR